MTLPAAVAPPKTSPAAILTLGVLAVSTGAIFVRTAHAPALVTAAYRVGIAVAVLLPVAAVKARGELLGLTRGELRLAVLSGVFLALHFALWISSLDFTTVSNSVVLVDTNPLWVGIMTPLVTGERLRPLMVVSIALSVIGGVLIGAGDFSIGPQALLGDGLALSGGICSAAYLLLGRRLRARLSLLGYIVVCYGSAAVLLWLAVLLLGLPVSGFTPATWSSFLGLALVSQILGHSSYNWALRWCSAGLIAVSMLGEPVISSILAYFLLDEGLTLIQFAGGGSILIAIYLAAVSER